MRLISTEPSEATSCFSLLFISLTFLWEHLHWGWRMSLSILSSAGLLMTDFLVFFVKIYKEYTNIQRIYKYTKNIILHLFMKALLMVYRSIGYRSFPVST